jgi:hypothetical protein
MDVVVGVESVDQSTICLPSGLYFKSRYLGTPRGAMTRPLGIECLDLNFGPSPSYKGAVRHREMSTSCDWVVSGSGSLHHHHNEYASELDLDREFGLVCAAACGCSASVLPNIETRCGEPRVLL